MPRDVRNDIRRTRYVDEDGVDDTAVAPAQEEVQEEVIEEREAVGGRPAIVGLFYQLSAWVALAGVAVLTLLALRMGFMMADANPRARFVDFIYDISGPLVAPFQDIMRNRLLDNGGIFEPATAIAMGIFLLATIFTVLILWALAPRWFPTDRGAVVRRRVVHQP